MRWIQRHSYNKKKKLAPRHQFTPVMEAVESRLLLANLSITDLKIVDANASPMPSPVTGQKYYLQANWTTTDLSAGDSYIVRLSVDGIALDSISVSGAAGTNLPYYWYYGGWYASAGQHSATAIIDAANTVAETSESDNTKSISFSPVNPDIPTKMMWPLGNSHDPEIHINNFNDVDPRTNIYSDYSGGSYAYDGHDAFDIDIANAARMDAGKPVYAAAAGTVIAAVDGNYDRNTESPAKDPANYVAIDIGNGWVNYYYHLKALSVAVKAGDVVTAGQVLGLVGSSGNSTAAHLHFSTYHRGLPVETMYAPTAYFYDPPTYSPLVSPFITSAGISNGPIDNDFKEFPQSVTKFPADQNWNPWFWFYIPNIPVGSVVAMRWYRPDGTTYASNAFTQSGRSSKFQNWYVTGTSGIPGTWQVALSIDNVEMVRRSFTVTSAGNGEPEIRVESDNTYIIDGRSTAIDLGTFSSGANATAKNFVIRNTGAATLTVSNLVLPDDVTLVGTFPSTVPAGGSASFSLAIDTKRAGSKFGSVQFTTNDSDEGAFDFNVSGRVSGSLPTGSPQVSMPGPSMVILPGSSPQPIDPLATITDVSPGGIASGSMEIKFASGGRNEDRLSICNNGTAAGKVGVSGNSITLSGISVATFSGGSGTTPLQIVFNASATVAAAQEILRNVAYSNVGSNTTSVPRYISVSVMDSAGLVSEHIVKNVIFDGRSVTSLAITPTNSNAIVGSNPIFSAIGILSDGTTRDLTSLVNWSSSALSVATISSSGRASALASGSAVITATIGSASKSTNLTVQAPAVAPLNLSANLINPTYGQSLIFTLALSTVSGYPVPGGTVQFVIDGLNYASPVPVVNGSANSPVLASLNAGSHSISANYSGDANYERQTASPLSLQISKAQLVVSANSNTKIYGETNPVFTASYAGFVLNQDFSVLSGELSFQTDSTTSSHVGKYQIFPAGLISSNYSIAFIPGNLDVKPAQLTISAEPKYRTYGAVNPDFSATFSGFVLNQDSRVLSGILTFTTNADQFSHVGNYTITPGGLVSNDYDISYIAASLLVKPTALTITVDPKSRIYGSENPEFTVAYNGFVLNQDANSLLGKQSYSTTASPSSHAGKYSITASGLTSTDYAISYKSSYLTVWPASLTISAEPKTRAYGIQNPPLSVTFEGFVLGQDAKVLTGVLTCTTNATTSSHVGTYTITPAGLASSDYTITYKPADLTVTLAPLTVTAESKSRVYGTQNPPLTVTFSGFMLNQDSQVLTGGLTISTTATSLSHVGSYVITPGGLSSSDYSLVFIPANLLITPAALTIKADDKSINLGEAIPQLTVSYSGFVNGDTPAGLTSQPALTTSATILSASGDYLISIAGGSSPDYDISLKAGTLSIKPPPPVAVLRGQVKTIKSGKKTTTVLVLTFGGDLDAQTAQGISNYKISTPGKDGKYDTKDDQTIKIQSAVYDSKSRTVTITTKTALVFKPSIQLIASGLAIRDRAGQLIDGNGDSKPGGDAKLILTSKSI